MIFAVFFTFFLLFMDAYIAFTCAKDTRSKIMATGFLVVIVITALIPQFRAVGLPVGLLGPPLAIVPVWVVLRWGKSPRAADALPRVFGIALFLMVIFFLNAHNTSRSMFMDPDGVHYWLINFLNGFFTAFLHLAESRGIELSAALSAIGPFLHFPLRISSCFLGTAGFLSLAGGYLLYAIIADRFPAGTVPAIQKDKAFTLPGYFIFIPIVAAVAGLVLPPGIAVVFKAVVLFSLLCFFASGCYWLLRFVGRDAGWLEIFLIILLAVISVTAPALLIVVAIAGVVIRALGLHSFASPIKATTARTGSGWKIYIVPVAVIVLLAQSRQFTENFMPVMNNWLYARPVTIALTDYNAGNTCTEIEMPGGGFCIDNFEYPNVEGELPLLVSAKAEAEKLCEERDARLCSIKEWEYACSSGGRELRIQRREKRTGGSRKLCNQANNELLPAGTMPDCAPAEYREIKDLAGNAWEIVDSRNDVPVTVLKGGYFGYSDDYTTRCGYSLFIFDSQAAKMGKTHFGFRCCR